MTTTLHKPIKRKTYERRYERGKRRAIIVTLYPAGIYGVHEQPTPPGTRCWLNNYALLDHRA